MQSFLFVNIFDIFFKYFFSVQQRQRQHEATTAATKFYTMSSTVADNVGRDVFRKDEGRRRQEEGHWRHSDNCVQFLGTKLKGLLLANFALVFANARRGDRAPSLV